MVTKETESNGNYNGQPGSYVEQQEKEGTKTGANMVATVRQLTTRNLSAYSMPRSKLPTKIVLAKAAAGPWNRSCSGSQVGGL